MTLAGKGREPQKHQMDNANDQQHGIAIRVGDRPYIPKGALKMRMRPDGTLDMGVSLAVDPWLPDLSTDAGTPLDVIEAIGRQGFPVSSICSNSINACQKNREVRELLPHPEIARLTHMVVIDGTQAIGILDLDKARGQVRYDEEHTSFLVEEMYEPLNAENILRGESPLIDYVLTADTQPFRLVELPGNKLRTVDVEDLQKLPVRILLFMHFVQLEDMLVRRLVAGRPELLSQLHYEQGLDAEPLGNSGTGPVKRVERYRFRKLLREAKDQGVLKLRQDELPFLERYRNRLAHGPAWYITRRSEVATLVTCFKRVLELIRDAARDDKQGDFQNRKERETR